ALALAAAPRHPGGVRNLSPTVVSGAVVAYAKRLMKPTRLLLGFVAIALVLDLVAPTVAGGQTPDPRKRRDELANAIEDATAEELVAIRELQAATAKRQVLEGRVAELDSQVADATRQVEAAEAEIARITAQIETVQREIERIMAEIEQSKARFNDSAVQLY